MRALILAALILTPLAFAVFKPLREHTPKIDRQANRRRVMELMEFSGNPGYNPPMPRQPAGYPSDPDCMTSEYQP